LLDKTHWRPAAVVADEVRQLVGLRPRFVGIAVLQDYYLLADLVQPTVRWPKPVDTQILAARLPYAIDLPPPPPDQHHELADAWWHLACWQAVQKVLGVRRRGRVAARPD
jgi:hypothetical protein